MQSKYEKSPFSQVNFHSSFLVISPCVNLSLVREHHRAVGCRPLPRLIQTSSSSSSHTQTHTHRGNICIAECCLGCDKRWWILLSLKGWGGGGISFGMPVVRFVWRHHWLRGAQLTADSRAARDWRRRKKKNKQTDTHHTVQVQACQHRRTGDGKACWN